MAAPAAEAKSNEPGQAALDAVNLGRIREAQAKVESAAEGSKSAVNSLRGIYAVTKLQNLNTDAAKVALKLVVGGEESIDEYCEEIGKVRDYVQLLGKVL